MGNQNANAARFLLCHCWMHLKRLATMSPRSAAVRLRFVFASRPVKCIQVAKRNRSRGISGESEAAEAVEPASFALHGIVASIFCTFSICISELQYVDCISPAPAPALSRSWNTCTPGLPAAIIMMSIEIANNAAGALPHPSSPIGPTIGSHPASIAAVSSWRSLFLARMPPPEWIGLNYFILLVLFVARVIDMALFHSAVLGVCPFC